MQKILAKTFNQALELLMFAIYLRVLEQGLMEQYFKVVK